MGFRISVFLVWCGGLLAASGAVDFVHEVVPVLKKHCVECHTDGTYKGSLSMDNREALLGTEKVGEEILYRIGADDEDDVMPPLEWKGEVRGRMSAEEVAVLEAWVAEGLVWDDAIAFKAPGYDAPVLPREVALPADVGNGVDWIVGEYFEQRGVEWPGEIEDAAWLRRVSLDLVGLLPAVEEVKSFVADAGAGKRSEKVLELLGRERDYADHWMTFWNDLLRNDYAGTGFIDGGRKQISKWLYASLVGNKRYDEFVRELIAPPDGESAGFIKGIKWRGNVNASQVEEVQFAQNVAQVFLGENLKCASCHDSFIDDWKLDDAYAMAAIVADRELELHRCDKPTGEMAKAGFLFKEVGDVDAGASKVERLEQTAALMTSEKNGRLARTLVNRLWQRLAGRGIVEPVDIMGNEPWSEDLLDWLAWDLQASGYDVKRTLGVIASSRIYGSATVEPRRAGGGDYVFRGPVAKRMTAEQFVDAVWGLTGGGKTKVEAPVELPVVEAVGGVELKGMRWIWDRADAASVAAPGRVVMRRRFELAGGVKSGVLALTCDNGYAVSVNGQKVGADDDWNSVERYE
ncbi:MAG: DUF1549 domain-containing protein, partial [Verrucomicrobiales bacterium]|nr:DUF1549 domain-containing protein [Verrucomicrobiales bacterium]